MTRIYRPGFTKEGGYEEPLYFQTPRCLVREGIIKELTEGSCKTLITFYYLTFYYKSATVQISIDVLREHTGLSKPAQLKATKDLESKGHIMIEKGAQGTPSTYRMNISDGSDSYVAFIEHRKPPKQKPPNPKPQDMDTGKESLPVGDRERMFTSTGKESLPPNLDTKGVLKDSEVPTTTYPTCGSCPEDSTGEGNPEVEIGNVYQPRHFSVPSVEAILDYLDIAGDLEVLNDSLETLDRDIGKGKVIHYRHGYLLEVIKRKRLEAAHLGPAPVPDNRSEQLEEEGPDKTPEERAANVQFVEWFQDFRQANPDVPPPFEAVEYVQDCIRNHGAPPSHAEVMEYLRARRIYESEHEDVV